jgi:hypothetical protein
LKNPSAQFSELFHHNIRPQRKYAIFRLRRIKIGLKSKRNTGLSLLTLFVASLAPLFSRAIIALASKACVVSMRQSFGISRPPHFKRLDMPFES